MARRDFRPSPWRCNRRLALKLLGGSGLWVSAGSLGALAACAPGASEAESPYIARIPLDRLPPGGRITIEAGDEPVELLRTPEGVRARSLLCTHFGCQVRWKQERGVYECPCHDGVFNAAGRVIAGPPPSPLRTLPVKVEGSQVVVDARRPTAAEG